MKNKFLRQWTMLRHIPRRPAKKSTRQLKELLEKQGFEVTQRTIQRDLKALAAVLPGLEVDEEKDFPGWFWSKDTLLHEVPSMDSNMALTFQLAGQFLETMFPPTVLDQLKPYFDSADNVLRALDNSGYNLWQEKVRLLPRTQPLTPAKISGNVIAVVYEALFKGQQFRGRYIKRHGDEVAYDLHPLGLIFRESVVYLVATIWNYQTPRHFALHRFRHCEILDEKATVVDGFNLDAYLSAGSFEYCETEGGKIRLKAVFYDDAGLHLLETPLSNDQKTADLEQGLQIEATVKDSSQLRWWLLGFGDKVEVLEPMSLRKEFAAISDTLVTYYI